MVGPHIGNQGSQSAPRVYLPQLHYPRLTPHHLPDHGLYSGEQKLLQTPQKKVNYLGPLTCEPATVGLGMGNLPESVIFGRIQNLL